MNINPFPLVYVAGPYSGDEQSNTRKACQFGGRLLDRGVACVVPHLTHYWDKEAPRSYDEWIALDMVVLGRCDAVARMRGASPGADREVSHALSLGLMVIEQGEKEGDAAFAKRMAAWAKAVRDRPRVLLVVEESGQQCVRVGARELWDGDGMVWPSELLADGRVGASKIDGVSVVAFDEDEDVGGEAVWYRGVEIGRWPYPEECYAVDVLSALRDAGAITLRVVDEEVMP